MRPSSRKTLSPTKSKHTVSGRGSRHVRQVLWRALIAIAVLILPQAAAALAFAPSEREWATWPEYCQARYTVSGAGSDSQFAGRVDPALVRNWESRLGPDVWAGLHHYCAGLIIATRAKAEPDKRQREAALRRVIDEYSFTLRRMRNPHPMRAEVAARKGMIHSELGQADLAQQDFDMAIKDCPKCSVGYQAKAMFYRDQGQLAKARQVLDDGDKALGGESAEIHYFLGLLLLDLSEFSAAQGHARRAYELGYPLPGLRDQLARAGHPIEE